MVGGALREPSPRYAFSLLEVADIDEPGRIFTVSHEETALMSPNTGTPPVFATKRDADLTATIYGSSKLTGVGLSSSYLT